MRSRAIAVLVSLVLALCASPAWAQSQTGEIFGKVTDQSGAVLPGVSVTLTSPILLQPLTAVTSGAGSFQFPRLAVGTYDVTFDLAGFRPVIKKGIQVTVGFSANVSTQLGLSTLTEAVTVTGESPIVDTKQTGTKQTFTTEMLQSIPSARDPWVILQQTAGIAMDRENIGGNMSGQQSNFVSRGASPGNTKWSVDGVDTTDMAATGASPTYYDFDAFQEMTINTGGVDVSQQTSGVGVNLVTKSGTNRFKGSGRFFNTNDRFESNNITDAQRKQGATSGNPIQDVKDYGVEMGGPLKKGRAWIWGSYGKQDINVGVLGFYKPTAQCQSYKNSATALGADIKDINACLNSDTTLLVNTNIKAEVQLFTGNKLSLFNSMSKKERNARGADDLHPIETTSRQSAAPSTFGTKYWITGPSPTYKFGDQWVISDRLLVDVQYAHVGNNFILDFHEDALKDVQPTSIISTGLAGRSGGQSVFLRPVNSVNVNASYFLPGRMGADHAFKMGGYWRDAYSESIGHTGGNATVRFPTSVDNDCSTLAAGCQVNVTRDSHTIYDLTNISLFAQDTITRGRATLQLGLRWDRNHDRALGASIPASPLLPDWLPAVNFEGVDPKIIFNDISPRLGFTYDVTGGGRTILRANYARYFGQVGTAGVAGAVNPLSGVTVRYPWVDANGDKSAQTSEILASSRPLTTSGNWSATNPTFVGTENTIDPNLKNDTTDEVIVGGSREIGRGFAVDLNYIWRRYGNFDESRRNGITSADYVEATFTPTAAQCPVAGARCETVTYFYPGFQAPNVTTRRNVPGYTRGYNGFEVIGRKRMADHWMMNGSFSYNSIIQHYDSPDSYLDPTNVAQRNGYQYDYATGGSGIGNVYVNAKWLFKLSGMYQFPYDVNVSAFYNARQGYPFEQVVRVSGRPNGGGTADVLLDPIGENRLPNFQNLDLHVERPVSLGRAHFVPSIDIFNVMNSNTVQAVRGIQNASNANNIQAIVAPRVLRFGVRVNW